MKTIGAHMDRTKKEATIWLIVIFLLSMGIAHATKEKPTLKGWGDKFFEVLDQEVENTKEFQKDNWLDIKKKFKKLFGKEDKDWEELDKELENE